MIPPKCFVCGSSSMRADRALSGRLVCNSCGAPLGVKKRGGKILNNSNNFSLDKKYFIFLILLILAFILVII
tara:strand:- start:2294 stop:2509 length:216 start_codon:yes stop_codon:yes gene_type:complete